MQLESICFYSKDIKKAVEFYRDVIGLEVGFIQEGKFASFKFENGVNLAIKKAVEKREIPGAQTLFIKSKDISEDNKKMKLKHAVFYKELTEENWGSQFSILDPDQNKILFMQRK